MGRRRVLSLWRQGTLKFFLSLGQRGDLQLQSFQYLLLRRNLIVQRLDSVILKSQASFKFCKSGFEIHSYSPNLKSSVSTNFNLSRMAEICSCR